MGRPVRVLLVDDSVFLRQVLAKRLEEAGIAVVGSAVDGLDALAKIPALKPDVVILDIEMPRMDGLAALQRIMVECPTPVVMLSALTQRGARTTIQALMRGAVDFVPKPAASIDIKSVLEELTAKVKMAAGTSLSSASVTGPASEAAAAPQMKPRPFRSGDPVIVIGSSTGGPRALQQVLSGLPANLEAAVVVVQHMPAGFTGPLAQRLNENSAFAVEEATSGKHLARGLALVAPGDYHLRFEAGGRVILDQGPRRNHLRPAVDITMESAASYHKSATVGVVLTGMGSDGTEGAWHIKTAGGKVIAEHESTCVVYGMPRSVIEAGLADQVVVLPRIASTLVEWVR
jgi:two-component system chemotaxis response regulator CheB